MNLRDLIEANLLPVRHLQPAALGFAPGIDWVATSVLLGAFAVLIFTVGAITAMVLRGRVPIPGQHAPSPPADPAADRPECKTLAVQRKALVGGSVKGYADDGLIVRPAEVVVYKWSRS